jgi:3-methyladenine DNA glycosylase AlkD
MAASTTTTVRLILADLERRSSRKNRDGMARYGIVAKKAFGVSVSDLRAMAKKIGRDHGLAAALWKTRWYEARLLAVFVDDPAKVTSRQMDSWAKGFENWADCDTACFHLFDKTPFAWTKIEQWSRSDAELVKRAAFALLASVALHDKTENDAPFVKSFRLIVRASGDDRNFVKKGVSWALRGIGHRNPKLRAAAMRVAGELAQSDAASARWIGRDAIRDLARPARSSRK